jgi:hypothetical protein
MRTKTLLIAAAALAATIISSEAQTPVYSANIVGYINVTNVGGQFTLLNNPLDNGTNTLNSLFPSVPTGSQVQIWNGTGFNSSTKLGANWSPNSTIAVGQGFFLKLAASGTNTFAGSVVVQSGGSVTNNLTAGVFALVGPAIPFADTLGSTNINLQLPTGSQVQVWNGTGFNSSTKLGANWSPNLTILPGQGLFVKSTTSTNYVESLILQ